MQNKMRTFLTSIGIEDVERFDMDFVLVARNPYQTDKIDMAIEKEEPWDFSLLEEFMDASATIRYPFSIRFSYSREVTPDDVGHLLMDWHLSRYRDIPDFTTDSPRANVISLTYDSEEAKAKSAAKVKDLKELFAFINYPYTILEKVDIKKVKETPVEIEVQSNAVTIEEVAVEHSEFKAETIEVKPIEKEEKPSNSPIESETSAEQDKDLEASNEEEFIKDNGVEIELYDIPSEAEKPQETAVELTLKEAEMPIEMAASPTVEQTPIESKPESGEDFSGEDWKPVEPIDSTVDEEAALEMDERDELLRGDEMIEHDRISSISEAEDQLLRQKMENRRRMEEERNNKRVWTVGDYKPLKSIREIFSMPVGNVDFSGVIFEGESKMSRKGNLFGTFGMGDDQDAVTLRVISSKRLPESRVKEIKPGEWFRVRGAIDTDKYSGQRIVVAHFVDPISAPEVRGDPEPVKRVELHLHSNMSTLDGIPEIKSYVDLASHMGMDAIALTDHGVIQAFPAAQKAAESIRKKGKPFKMIYGAELYMFDRKPEYIMNPANIPLRGARYCVFDTETTGLSARYDRMVEFGGVIIEGGNVVKRWDTFINPEIDLSHAQEALAINHITEEQVLRAPKISEVLPKILEFIGDTILVAHNASFDIGFLNAALERAGLPPISNPVIDTLPLSHYFFPFAGRHNEGALLKNLGLQIYNEKDAHRADYDANALSEGWQVMLVRLESERAGITHADLADLEIKRGDPSIIGNPDDPEDPGRIAYLEQEEKFNAFCRHIYDYHCVVLCKNQKGLSSLYRIVSEGHTTYLGKASLPKTPRDLIEELREDLLVGSACFNSEIFEIAMTRGEKDLVKAVSFYDYIEIQPLENYSWLLNMGRLQSKEQLIEILRNIIDAAHEAGKPVVATGDVHYLNPEDQILRDVYIYSKTIGGGTHPMNPPARGRKPIFANPEQHFRSTREMLDSFEQWMSKEEAYEYVVTNSRMIADMISPEVEPVHDKLFKPDANLPHADQTLHDLCYKNFEDRYAYLGDDNDPEVLEAIANTKKRLDRELAGIIGNGYAVTYIIAARLIKMANDEPEHYIVGSRGSVGSSFAATMADITEVNPLPAHYHCPKCHYLHYEDSVKYKSGFDLPDKTCPKCGTLIHGNGQNIPFETFLGFAAEKVPDIDLNFEDESQKKAHNYTKILLGENNVYRAGTIETVAEKTAYGLVRGYFEKIGINPDTMNPTYIAYLASRCQGVKRTTGQHPGGIVVIPADHQLYDFTAIQHPADDLKSDWLTTHYDFHAIHDEVLKLDILGHVDPMAMRYYRDLTGVRIEDIPMNDPAVLKLFTSNEPLKLQRNYLNSITGAAALPEFGTNQGLSMLEETKPTTFNDLLILSGLAHGTNVWANNAEDLVVKEGKTLNDVIGCRDDIMTYLISKGMDPSASFTIMEQVRKGKKVKPEQEDDMRAHGVPDYYINSCNKIAYLFPRGHATAYVMMAVRVAYFKLYYPLHFYAVFFSIRSDDYDIKSMIEGEEAVIAKIEALRARMGDRANPLTNKEDNIYKTLLIALEMLERGYHFANIDLYRSDWHMFVVDEERKALIPPFTVIDGLGDNAAKSICEARLLYDRNGNVVYDENGKPKFKEFISKRDLLNRAAKLNSTSVEKLSALGVLDGLSEENQLTLF